MDRILRLLTWPAALFIAGILLWYEQYKLTGNEGSVWLFTVLSDWLHIHGYEKPFRLFVASMEIVASVLVVLPWTRVFGAALALGVMSGALFFHLVSPLGIDPYGDGGVLFKQACSVWLAAAFILLVRRHDALALACAVLQGGGRRLGGRGRFGHGPG
ncbi:MAG: DoxX family protein [Acetobacteraceae bacterium]|nr:DoxX family protein [Acetobacteraceae bacterium]